MFRWKSKPVITRYFVCAITASHLTFLCLLHSALTVIWIHSKFTRNLGSWHIAKSTDETRFTSFIVTVTNQCFLSMQFRRYTRVWQWLMRSSPEVPLLPEGVQAWFTPPLTRPHPNLPLSSSVWRVRLPVWCLQLPHLLPDRLPW